MKHMKISGQIREIDSCIFPIVKALNDAGLVTDYSCCGHGNTIGDISLVDGRQLIIAKDMEQVREVHKMFPDIWGEPWGGE